MIDIQQLQQDTSKLLDRKVLAVGIFDASLKFGHKRLAPAAAGVATYWGTKLVEQKLEYEGTGATATAVAAGVAGAIGTQKLLKHQNVAAKGLTPVMVCAVTANRIYLLDWKGDHKSGEGATKVLMEFTRAHSKIQVKNKRHNHHVIELKEDGDKVARIECSVGTLHSKKTANQHVLKLLKEASKQQ